MEQKKVRIESLDHSGEWKLTKKTGWHEMDIYWKFIYADGVVRYYAYKPNGNIHAFRQVS